MGSTGHSSFRRGSRNINDTETFGIKNAVNYKGKVPSDSGLMPVASNKITLKVPAPNNNNIIFQFSLSKDEKNMTIIGYKDGVPEVKAKVAVDAGSPSLDKVIATGSKSEKNNALKMKDLMNKSSEVSENQLGAIANKLLEKRNRGK